ncbi:hypothetical protein [uncultured Bradyrhizobium sp.]|uniref:hypothetical protein n=1 Tax=Bradyrhizobium sp. TaxID=376 RepID=UPI002611CF7F|nr:hypothetical protein [uncultured Bradyrhizobium sp.]
MKIRPVRAARELRGSENPLLDFASALNRGTGDGASAFDGRLELRAPRRSQKSRRRKKLGIYYVVSREGAVSTGIRENEPDRAQRYLDGYRARRLNETLGRVLPGSLTFATVIADHVDNVRRSAKTPGQRRRAAAVEYQSVVLNRFFGTKTLSEYRMQMSIDFKNQYIDERNAFYDANPDRHRKDPESTATQLLRLLRYAIRSYPERHGYFWVLNIHVPKPGPKKPARWLRRQEVARLLLACMGYRWDHERGDWMTKEVIRADGTTTITRKVAPENRIMGEYLSRVIRFITKTGTRHDVMLSMAWGSRMRLACIVANADGSGWIHRRGLAEIDTTKARPSTEIVDDLKCLIRAWGRQDGYILPDGTISKQPKHKYLIRPPGGGNYKTYLNVQFRKLCNNAGLSRDVTIHSLKHTAVSWAYQRGVSLAAAEQMLGTSAETLLAHYVHWGHDSRISAKDEFNNYASRRKLRAIHHHDPEPDDRVRPYDRPFKGRTRRR